MQMVPVTCMMGQLYAQQERAHAWLVEQGIDPGSTRQLTEGRELFCLAQ